MPQLIVLGRVLNRPTPKLPFIQPLLESGRLPFTERLEILELRRFLELMHGPLNAGDGLIRKLLGPLQPLEVPSLDLLVCLICHRILPLSHVSV